MTYNLTQHNLGLVDWRLQLRALSKLPGPTLRWLHSDLFETKERGTEAHLKGIPRPATDLHRLCNIKMQVFNRMDQDSCVRNFGNLTMIGETTKHKQEIK